MDTTLRPIIDTAVRSVCGHDVERLIPLTGGGMNETYRAELGKAREVVVRIARQQTPWFIDEARLVTRAREAGIPTAEVLGLEHVDNEGELLSLSIQQYLPGRSLSDLTDQLSDTDRSHLIMDAGEILARIHSLEPTERDTRHELRLPDATRLAQITTFIEQAIDSAASDVVERAVEVLRRKLATRPTQPFSLTQGDFLPKNLIIDHGKVSGVIDWEFAGSAPPAYDLARWEVSAGAPWHDRSDLLHRGYARLADPVVAAADLTAAYAIDWVLEMLGWTNPATPEQVRRCIDVLARYATDH